MGDGKALQMGTSHELGQNFAKVFDITYLDANGDTQLCWTTSWGTSTRMVGGLIMAHGDDQGLRGPARAWRPSRRWCCSSATRTAPATPPTPLAAELKAAGVRVRLDAQVATSFGRRATDWEIKGVPVRIEVGPRDLAEGHVTLVRRDTGEKRTVPVGEVAHRVTNLLAQIQAELLAAATKRRDDRTVEVTTDRRGHRGRPRSASPGSPGTSSRTAARPASPRTPSPSAASRPPTAASPPARTTPTSSPTSPGATRAASELDRWAGIGQPAWYAPGCYFDVRERF